MVTNPVAFLKEVKEEMAKVSWLSRKETARFTGIVIVGSAIVALYVASLDFAFTKIIELVVK